MGGKSGRFFLAKNYIFKYFLYYCVDKSNPSLNDQSPQEISAPIIIISPLDDKLSHWNPTIAFSSFTLPLLILYIHRYYLTTHQGIKYVAFGCGRCAIFIKFYWFVIRYTTEITYLPTTPMNLHAPYFEKGPFQWVQL